MTTLEESADEVIETDILVVGGGLAGCMATIRARDKNIKVALIEKSAISRSGAAGLGLDHYPAISHPLWNGITGEEYGYFRADDFPGIVSTHLSIVTAKSVIKPINILEEIGVKIREEDGSLKVHAVRLGGIWGAQQDFAEKRSQVWDGILYRGADLKLKLAEAVRKRGARVFERTMLTSLITRDGSVVGATALNVRNGKFLVFKTNFILLATGGMQSRLYESSPFVNFPKNLFTHYNCPANAGGGHAAAYRAGAKLINVEFVHVRNAPLARDPGPPGQTMYAKLKNSKGEELRVKYSEVSQREKTGGIPFMTLPFQPNMSEPEIERDALKAYVDEISDVEEWHGNFMAASETPFALKALRERGGLRTAPLDMAPYYHGLPRSVSGVKYDDKGETSIKDLFVAGDMVGGLPQYGAPGAFAWGYRIGDYLREAAPDAEKPVFDGEQVRQVQMERERVLTPLRRRGGVNPLQLEDLVRKIVTQFVGMRKSEPRLKRCLEFLEVIKERYVPVLMASNPHELMRAVEVQDIIEIAEIHTQAALLRTESRMPPSHYRTDYPEQDDEHWQTSIVVNKVDGVMKYTLEKLE